MRHCSGHSVFLRNKLKTVLKKRKLNVKLQGRHFSMLTCNQIWRSTCISFQALNSHLPFLFGVCLTKIWPTLYPSKLRVHTTLLWSLLTYCSVLHHYLSCLKVKLNFEPSTTSPGKKTTITLSVHRGSNLAIAAIDKSLHILGDGNQITKSRVSTALWSPIKLEIKKKFCKEDSLWLQR